MESVLLCWYLKNEIPGAGWPVFVIVLSDLIQKVATHIQTFRNKRQKVIGAFDFNFVQYFRFLTLTLEHPLCLCVFQLKIAL